MPARYLRGNKGTEIPNSLIFVDTESYSTVDADNPRKRTLTLRLWCATFVRLESGKVTRRIESHGFDAQSFYDFVVQVSNARRCTWIFAHNLGFDLTQLAFWQRLDERFFTLEPLYKNGTDGTPSNEPSWYGKLCLEINPTFIQCRRERATYKFVDTCNYWPSSLGLVAERYGMAKMELPPEYAPNECWLAYCRNDVSIIEQAVIRMLLVWKKEDCGVFQLTAPMVAMHNFQHKCTIRTPDTNDVDIVCMPDHKSHELERDSYFGGRIQCFQVGEINERVYKVDCNSLYGHMMIEHSFPRRLVRYQEGGTVDELRRISRVYGCVAKVLISTRHNEYPVRIDGRQYHCTGRYWAALCGPELHRALANDDVYQVAAIQSYSIAPLFRDWATYWTNRKIEAKIGGIETAGDYEFAKLILTSLSGKFSQHGKHWRDIPGRIPLDRWGAWTEYDCESNIVTRWRGVAGNSQLLTNHGEPAHSFPLISAYITAHGREYMRSVIALAGPENVFYMSTDALILNHKGYMELVTNGYIHPTQTGKFKVEETATTCEISGSNNYSIGTHAVASGMYGRAIKARKANQPVEQWEQLPQLITNCARDSVHIEEVEVENVRPDHRGLIGPDCRWHPYRLSHDEDFTDRVSPRQRFAYCSSGKLGGRILLSSYV